ncbi:MAG: GntR family transcriptional regulator [Magnetovibrionaceae bacterium]
MTDRLADHIAEKIENEIFQGGYADGDRLDEVRLAESFGVSRTPVREAFQRLAQSGLVEQLPRRGVFVKQPGPIDLLQMFEFMAELEGVCARLAAVRISDKALEELTAANAACSLAAENGDTDGYYYENETFHSIIYRASGNSFLAKETEAFRRRLRPFRRTQLQLRGRMAQSLAEHGAVIEALKLGDAELSAGRLRGHVAIQGEKFHYLVAKMGDAAE